LIGLAIARQGDLFIQVKLALQIGQRRARRRFAGDRQARLDFGHKPVPDRIGARSDPYTFDSPAGWNLAQIKCANLFQSGLVDLVFRDVHGADSPKNVPAFNTSALMK
jgi:hypothetical protein